jgi:hypothetical protein
MNELKDVLKPFDVYTKILEAEEVLCPPCSDCPL